MLILLHAKEGYLSLPEVWVGGITNEELSHSHEKILASEVQLRCIQLKGNSSIDLNIIVDG